MTVRRISRMAAEFRSFRERSRHRASAAVVPEFDDIGGRYATLLQTLTEELGTRGFTRSQLEHWLGAPDAEGGLGSPLWNLSGQMRTPEETAILIYRWRGRRSPPFQAYFVCAGPRVVRSHISVEWPD
jgi:hypothetical protein